MSKVAAASLVNAMYDTQEIALLVFTDLDGTLLDHDSYSAEDAEPALKKLESLQVPVIPVTSKTFDELLKLSENLPFHHPWIIENGGAIVLPQDYFLQPEGFIEKEKYRVHTLGPAYAEILEVLGRLRESTSCRFKGFNDLTNEQVAEKTGLSLEDAARARSRMTSEPIEWQDSDEALQDFKARLSEQNLTLVQGGRFWHVMGRVDKAYAIKQLCNYYEQAGYTGFKTIALGDSPNDRMMLESVDVPVVIRKNDGSCMTVNSSNRVFCSNQAGPAGWNEFILQYLEKNF